MTGLFTAVQGGTSSSLESDKQLHESTETAAFEFQGHMGHI